MGPTTMGECLICFDSVLGSIAESSEAALLKLSRVSKLSVAICNLTPLNCLPPSLLCKGCQLDLNTCVELLDDIEELQCRFEGLVKSVKNKLVRSYYNKIQNREDDMGSEKEKGSGEVQRIRRAYAQCWSPCSVRISSRDRYSGPDFHKTVQLLAAPSEDCNEFSDSETGNEDGAQDALAGAEEGDASDQVNIGFEVVVKHESDDDTEIEPELLTSSPGNGLTLKNCAYAPIESPEDRTKGSCEDTQSDLDFMADESEEEDPAGENEASDLDMTAGPLVEEEKKSNHRPGRNAFSSLKSHKIKKPSDNKNARRRNFQTEAECTSSDPKYAENPLNTSTSIPIQSLRKRARMSYKDVGDTSDTNNDSALPIPSEDYQHNSAREDNDFDDDFDSSNLDQRQKDQLTKKDVKNYCKESINLRALNTDDIPPDAEHVCKLCQKSFSTALTLRVHTMRKHVSKNEQIRCETCKVSFLFQVQLARHNLWHENSGKCPACEDVYESRKEFDKHLIVHIKNQTFKLKRKPTESLRFPCEYCSEVFKTVSAQAMHRQSHQSIISASFKEAEFKCSQCTATTAFVSMEELMQHQKDAHGVRIPIPINKSSWACPYCPNNAYTDASSLRRHLSEVHPEDAGQFQCSVCKEPFSSKHDHDDHLLLHPNDGAKDFQCLECDKRFPRLIALCLHFSRTHQKWTCNECGALFDGRKELLKHKRAEHGLNRSSKRRRQKIKYSFSCAECPMKFRLKHFYDLHMRRHANPEGTISLFIDATLDEDKNLILFNCTACNLTYTEREHLSPEGEFQLLCQHGNCSCETVYNSFPEYMTHHKIICTKKFFQYCDTTCPDCGKTLRSRSSLKNHIASVHPKSSRFQCEVCGRGYDLQNLLNSHVRQAHSTERNHQCEVCGAKFKSAGNLNVHMESHATEEAYVCEVCGKGFTRKDGLRRHMSTHIETATVPCPICGKLFKSKGYMKNHIYTTHEKRRAPKKGRSVTPRVNKSHEEQVEDDSRESD